MKVAIVITITEENQEEFIELSAEKEIPFAPAKGMSLDFWHFYGEINHVTYSFSTGVTICEIEYSLSDYGKVFCEELSKREDIINNLIHRLIYEGFDLTNWTDDSQEKLANKLAKEKARGDLKPA